MSFEESPENKFESLIKASDGELVKESEIEKYEVLKNQGLLAQLESETSDNGSDIV